MSKSQFMGGPVEAATVFRLFPVASTASSAKQNSNVFSVFFKKKSKIESQNCPTTSFDDSFNNEWPAFTTIWNGKNPIWG